MHASRSGGYITVVILVLVALLGIVLADGFSYFLDEENEFGIERGEEQTEAIALLPEDEEPQDSLQLRSFPFVTVTPTPEATPTPTDAPTPTAVPTVPASTIPPTQPPVVTFPPAPQPSPPPSNGECIPPEGVIVDDKPCCNTLSGRMFLCRGDLCARTDPSPDKLDMGQYGFPGTCGYFVNRPGHKQYDLSSCEFRCIAKPVIYLYPEKPTYIDVKLEIPNGRVAVSDPLYPEETGWQNVLAYPNGELIYKGKKYRDLFYETEVRFEYEINRGVYLAKNSVYQEVERYLTLLGLNDFEKSEYLEYWMPEVEKIEKDFVLFSVLTPNEKHAVDRVYIDPVPDTEIMFLTHFKGVDIPYPVEKQDFPAAAKERKGFTVVEWGGSIDY